VNTNTLQLPDISKHKPKVIDLKPKTKDFKEPKEVREVKEVKEIKENFDVKKRVKGINANNK